MRARPRRREANHPELKRRAARESFASESPAVDTLRDASARARPDTGQATADDAGLWQMDRAEPGLRLSRTTCPTHRRGIRRRTRGHLSGARCDAALAVSFG